jgi:PAS domain S-box-containing protein
VADARHQPEPEYRAIFDASSDGLVINDPVTGVVLEANAAFCRMHGYEDMVGLHPTVFVHPAHHHLLAEYVSIGQAGGEFRRRAQDVRRDGSVFDVEVFGRGFTYHGQLALLGVVRDVTEQVHAYRLLEERVVERTREIERRREVAEGMREILAVVNSQRSLDDILAFLVTQASRILGSAASAIYLPEVSDGQTVLAVRAFHGLDENYAAVKIPSGRAGTGLAFELRRPVGVYDVAAAMPVDPSEARGLELEYFPSHIRAVRMSPGERVLWRGAPVSGYRAALAVPLSAKDDRLGVLTLYYRAPREFSDEEVWLATAFADQAALAVENARLFTQSERQRRQMEILYRADEMLHRSLQLQDVLRALVEVATDVLGADKTSVLIWDAAHEHLVIGAARGYAPETLARLVFNPGEGIAGRVAVSGQPMMVDDSHTDPRTAPRINAITAPEEIRSYVCVPIVVKGEVFAVFSVNYYQPQQFSDDDLRPLEALAQRAAVAIQNAELYERAQHAAVLEERQRLARELHDAVTQTLFSASLIAEVLPRLWDRDPTQVRPRLEELRRLSRGALAEMRTLLVELRPAALADMQLGDLLRQLAEATTSRGSVLVDVELDGEPARLPPEVNVGLYRLAQEALNNVSRHAEARHAWVRLRSQPGWLDLQIRDDGCGFNPDPALIPPGHFGMRIMRERAEALNLTLEVASQAGIGTTINIGWQTATQRSAVGRQQVGDGQLS